jgi:DNA-binding NarL/FixJ family response regulator
VQLREALVLAEIHRHNILNRLGPRSRTQIAAWAVRNGVADR